MFAQNEQTLVHHAGWIMCEQENLFSLYSCAIANHNGQLHTNHLHACTYLIVTKCFTYSSTYILVTIYVAYLLTYHTHHTYFMQGVTSYLGRVKRSKHNKSSHLHLFGSFLKILFGPIYDSVLEINTFYYILIIYHEYYAFFFFSHRIEKLL